MRTSAKDVVAIVDDDRRTLESLGELLEAAGFVVRAYSSAVALMQADGLLDIDCLISDIGMPDMNGFELRAVAAAQHPTLPVILITGRPRDAWQAPADVDPLRYFEKPYDGRKLLATITAAIADARRERS